MAGQSQSQNVAFLQGSNLPKQVLAQIWNHADQHKIGFLGRAEFYNALRLVTVAQSKRELTPDIVKAALYGPASAKIPAPQINFAAVPASSPNPGVGMTVPQSRAVSTTQIQSMGPRGPQVLTSASMGQQYFPSQQNHLGKPPRPMPPSTMFRPQQGIPGVGITAASAHPNTNVSNDWLGGGAGGSSAGTATQVSTRGITPSTAQDGFGISTVGMASPAQPRPPTTAGVMHTAEPKPHDLTPSSQVEVKDSKTLPGSTNGVASDSVFGDVFSVTSSQPKQESRAPVSSATNLPVSPSTAPVSSGPQPAGKTSTYGSSHNAFVQQTMGGQPQQVQSTTQAKQQVPVQSSTTFSSNSTGFPVGARNSASGQSQVPWPRMSPSDVQKYTKVFLEVDMVRDEKITGEQARNLFLSWRLPREVLKEVWDLSDQDNDSMLSLREFCIALYLMERYREGRPLPRTLPTNIMFDDMLLPASGQPTTAYGNANWRPTPGLQQAQVVRGAQAVTASTRARQTNQVPVRLPDEDVQPAQQKFLVPVLEKHLTSQLSEEEQNSLNSKFQEATEANKKGTPRMAGTVNWGTATVIGVFAGMLYGGSKEASASVSKDAEVMLKLGSTPDKREQYRLMRDAMEKRFLRVTRGSIVGGVRLGMFTASFYGLQNLLAEKRGVHDVYNVVGAGSATAATFGLILPGSLLWRARNVALGSILGATICFPLGWLQLKLIEKANEGRSAGYPESDSSKEAKSGVGAAIERLEGHRSK